MSGAVRVSYKGTFFTFCPIASLSANGKTQTEQEGKQPLFVEHKMLLDSSCRARRKS